MTQLLRRGRVRPTALTGEAGHDAQRWRMMAAAIGSSTIYKIYTNSQFVDLRLTQFVQPLLLAAASRSTKLVRLLLRAAGTNIARTIPNGADDGSPKMSGDPHAAPTGQSLPISVVECCSVLLTSHAIEARPHRR